MEELRHHRVQRKTADSELAEVCLQLLPLELTYTERWVYEVPVLWLLGKLTKPLGSPSSITIINCIRKKYIEELHKVVPRKMPSEQQFSLSRKTYKRLHSKTLSIKEHLAGLVCRECNS